MEIYVKHTELVSENAPLQISLNINKYKTSRGRFERAKTVPKLDACKRIPSNAR